MVSAISFLLVISHLMGWRFSILSSLIILFFAFVSFSILLELIITLQLFCKKYFAVANPIPKIGTGEDFADLASFLLSEKNNWITGQIFHIDGGRSTLRIKAWNIFNYL